jgi:hypothetical protein
LKYFEKNDNRILEMGTSALSLYKPNKIEELMRFKNAVMENFENWKKISKEENNTNEQLHNCFKMKCVCCNKLLYFSSDFCNPIKLLDTNMPHTICDKYDLTEKKS